MCASSGLQMGRGISITGVSELGKHLPQHVRKLSNGQRIRPLNETLDFLLQPEHLMGFLEGKDLVVQQGRY